MDLRYPHAEYRPLSTNDTEPVIGVPAVFIFHTMVGNLAGTEALFRKDGYNGNESTFGIGGPWDGANKDGVIFQWQELNRQADAQWDGNAYATSVEFSDGGSPLNPFSAKQIQAAVDLGVWWVRQTKNPAHMVSALFNPARAKVDQQLAARGFGYHRQFAAWNRNGHTCPGDVRVNQIRNIIVPKIHAALVVTTYKVKSGDSLRSISQMYYHTQDKWSVIYQANKRIIGPDPDLIHPGMVLRIP